MHWNLSQGRSGIPGARESEWKSFLIKTDKSRARVAEAFGGHNLSLSSLRRSREEQKLTVAPIGLVRRELQFMDFSLFHGCGHGADEPVFGHGFEDEVVNPLFDHAGQLLGIK